MNPTSSAPRRITLAHGAGGRLTADLVREVFLKRLHNPHLATLSDSAIVPVPAPVAAGEIGAAASAARIALTTDGFVVTPLFFPGGDIGKLAVFGTVNDLAVAGAIPAYLTASFIIEEGLPVADLARVVDSMAAAAREARVVVVAGDTKVVERGSCDGLFIATAGVGHLHPHAVLGPAKVRPGDCLVLSGPVGLHGVAVLSGREGLTFETTVRSDCASVAGLTVPVLDKVGPAVRWMRDPTRGGLATVACELGEEAGVAVVLEEAAVPVPPDVRGACEMFGLDPLYLANEGKVLMVVAPDEAGTVVALLREAGQPGAAIVGSVEAAGAPSPAPAAAGPPLGPGAYLRTTFGGTKPLERLSGDQLPRIC